MDDAYRNPAWLQDFVRHAGPQLHDEENTPWEIFKDLLLDDVIQTLVTETNRYADQYFREKGGHQNLPPHSRARSWKDVDANDMKAFIGLTLLMGMIQLPSYDLYWSTSWLLRFGMTGVMSRDRYLSILSFLHCADNDQMPPPAADNYDRLYKVRGILESFVESWKQAYTPDRELSFDETILAFKGTTRMKNYNPLKPHKWGLTVWSITEATTGYVYSWNVYTGKSQQVDPRTQNNDHRGSVHWVTWDSLENAGILNHGHHVYMDNYFSSLTLFDDLAGAGTGACGTLRRNRYGTPDRIKQAKVKKSDPPTMARTGQYDTLFISWMDRNLVNLVTNIHTDAMFNKRTRSKDSETGWQEREKPLAIEAYTRYMRGVDLADQAMWYCLLTHRTLKWWKKVLFGLLEVTFTNALVIYRKLHPGRRTDRNRIRLDIINNLVEGYRKGRAGPIPGPQQELRLTYGPGMHMPEFVTRLARNGKLYYPDCLVCSKRPKPGEENTRHQVTTQCNTCQVPLCPVPCFQRYHTMRNNFKLRCYKGLHSAEYQVGL